MSSILERRLTSRHPVQVVHRNQGTETAIVFIHGYRGDAQKTWGQFPFFLLQAPLLAKWDVFSIGYSSTLRADAPGLITADADLKKLSVLLRTTLLYPPLNQYRSLAILAHSMGGLIVQQVLLSEECRACVGHVFLFSTPSAGLVTAAMVGRWKRQFRDMAKNSDFIRDLRAGWEQTFAGRLPFRLRVVAGEKDEFVPGDSSLRPFAEELCYVVPGDHSSMVKPVSTDDLVVQLVVQELIGNVPPAIAWNNARVAVEIRDFQRAIDQLEPHAADLDPNALVQLALALESVGRSADALAILERHGDDRLSTDAMGVLAGRCKRRWLAERQAADAARARSLYARALQRSVEEEDWSQAFYHSINLAFLALMLNDNLQEARERAQQTLVYCARAEIDKWRLASEGEARLILGDVDVGLQNYRAALAQDPTAREIESMYHQAIRTAERVAGERGAKQVETTFQQVGLA